MNGPLEKITAFHAGPFVGLFVGTMESGSNCAQFIRLDLHEAAVAAARAEGRENAMQALAALGQAQEAYEAQTAIAAELAAAQQRLENGLKWCDLMDGPVSKSQFVNGQATAAQQIRAALRAESSK